MRASAYPKLHARLSTLYDCDCPDCNATVNLTNKDDSNSVQIPFDSWKKAYRKIWKKKGITPDMLSTSEAIRDAIDSTANVLSRSIADNTIPDKMAKSLREDVYIFSGFKTYHSLKEASELLTDNEGKVKPFNTFLKDIRGIHNKYNAHYLQAEYIFATQSAEMAAKWAEVEAGGDRYDLQYRTAADSKVRPEHQVLHGITLPASDQFWLEYYPPNGWRCRCTAIRAKRGKYERSDSEKSIAAGKAATEGKNEIFRFNPGRQKVIFPPHHPYYGKSGSKEAQDVKKNIIDNINPWTVVDTTRGSVRVHKNVKKNERAKNIKVATYLANTDGDEIDLIPVPDKSDKTANSDNKTKKEKKTADSYNKTKKRNEEYKVLDSATISSLDRNIKIGKSQAADIIIMLPSYINQEEITKTVENRIRRHKDINSVRIIILGYIDITYPQK